MILGLTLAFEMGAESIRLKTESQLVVSQIKGETQAKEPVLKLYI